MSLNIIYFIIIIMLLSSALKSSLLCSKVCSKIQIMLTTWYVATYCEIKHLKVVFS